MDGSSQRPRLNSWRDKESRQDGGWCLRRACKDGTSQQPGATSWGDGESCPSGRRCPWRACGGRHFPRARAHKLGERGVLPRRRSRPMEGLRVLQIPMARAHQLGGRGILPGGRLVPMEGLRGTALPNGPGPPPRRTRSCTQAAVGAYGGFAGYGSSQTACAHHLGRRGVLPKRRSAPMEGLQRTLVSNGPGPPARGTGSPTRVAVGAYGGSAGEGCCQRPGPTS